MTKKRIYNTQLRLSKSKIFVRFAIKLKNQLNAIINLQIQQLAYFARIMKNNKAVIVFTHIPKCAGTSFRSGLIEPNISAGKIYRSSSFKEILKYKQDFQYLIGHYPFGIERYLHPLNPARKRPKIRLVFLREPIDHMISYYYFQIQSGQYSKFWPQIKKQNIVDFYTKNYTARNLQTRFCAGVFYELIFRKILHNSDKNLLLNKAKKNLSKFNFVGLFENIEDDMKTIAKKYKLEYKPAYSQSTRTRKRPSVNELEENTKQILSRLNELDIQLYRFVKEDFKNQKAGL